MEREPLLYRTVSISQLSEIEPLLLASIVGGYMVTPYDFSNFSKYNNEDDDSYLQVCVSVVYVCIVQVNHNVMCACMCVWCVYCYYY